MASFRRPALRPLPSATAIASWLCALSLSAAATPPATAPRAGAQATTTTTARASRRAVQLTTLGDFPEPLLSAIAEGLRDELQVEVLPVQRHPLPRSAYYAPRERYRAEKLLDFMLRRDPRGSQLGLTSVDISTTKGKHRDWGVFGAAYVSDRVAVVSTFRLRKGARDAAHHRFRVVSTAVHEVGHMLGLDHCAEPRCVMNDAHGSIRTVDRSTGELGPGCRDLLERRAPLAPANATHR